MSWLLHNPLAEMYGPTFLMFYAVVIVLTIMICVWMRAQLDPTSQERPPLIPTVPDPYEIAYLRGGENEVTRLAVFDLIQRGYLEVRTETTGKFAKVTTRKLAQTSNPPILSGLKPLEETVFQFFASPLLPNQIFQSSLLKMIQGYCGAYERLLREERLLNTPESNVAGQRIAGVGVLVILGLGGYKLIVALMNGHDNVIFLILMGVIASIVLSVIAMPRRLSKRGRAYLSQLQQAFAPGSGITDPLMTIDPMVLMVGIHGVSPLSSTPHAYYAQMFAQGAASGGCGSGGGGGCGGGGGGGGCGGCGGGS